MINGKEQLLSFGNSMYAFEGNVNYNKLYLRINRNIFLKILKELLLKYNYI